MTDRTQTQQYGRYRVEVFESMLRTLPTGRLIDLGAGHGRFSDIAVRLGWDVTALDARTDRFPDALKPKVNYLHSSVDSDAWDGADYDLIACLGLYYHLDFPMQDRLLARCRQRPVFLDTHVTEGSKRTEWAKSLGRFIEPGGIRGRSFQEPAIDDDDRKQNRLLASYENSVSFWPTRAGLREHAARHGYRHVWELSHDFPQSERSAFLLLPG